MLLFCSCAGELGPDPRSVPSDNLPQPHRVKVRLPSLWQPLGGNRISGYQEFHLFINELIRLDQRRNNFEGVWLHWNRCLLLQIDHFVSFSGRDPATDLRGVGLLGLLHLVYLLRDAKRQVLASEIYKLSLHPTQVIYKLYSSWNTQQKYLPTIKSIFIRVVLTTVSLVVSYIDIDKLL